MPGCRWRLKNSTKGSLNWESSIDLVSAFRYLKSPAIFCVMITASLCSKIANCDSSARENQFIHLLVIRICLCSLLMVTRWVSCFFSPAIVSSTLNFISCCIFFLVNDVISANNQYPTVDIEQVAPLLYQELNNSTLLLLVSSYFLAMKRNRKKTCSRATITQTWAVSTTIMLIKTLSPPSVELRMFGLFFKTIPCFGINVHLQDSSIEYLDLI